MICHAPNPNMCCVIHLFFAQFDDLISYLSLVVCEVSFLFPFLLKDIKPCELSSKFTYFLYNLRLYCDSLKTIFLKMVGISVQIGRRNCILILVMLINLLPILADV